MVVEHHPVQRFLGLESPLDGRGDPLDDSPTEVSLRRFAVQVWCSTLRVLQGVDIFDSCFPTRMARHGLLFTRKGNIKIKSKKYEKDLTAIDAECECETCKHFTKAYLHHLVRVKEPNAHIHLTKHNLFFVHNIILKARESIKNDSFAELKKEYS